MIVFNELEYAEKLLQNGYKNTKYISFDNVILVKYWKHKGLVVEEIESKLKEFMKEFQELFNDNIIKYKIHKAITIGMKYDLIIDKEVNITQGELDVINSLKDINTKKILFVLLVIWKHKSNAIFRVANADILRLAEVKCNNDKFWDYIHELTSEEFISLVQYKHKDYYKIEVPEDGKKVISIKDYDNIIDYYLPIIYPEKYKNCEICGKKIRIKSNRTKYCSKCWEEEEKKLKRDWKRNFDKNKKSRSLEKSENH